MHYQLVVFDWDGTLMDSAGKIVNCMQMAARDSGVAIPSKHQVEHIIGISLVPAIAQLFALSDNSVVEKVVERYKYHFVNSDTVACDLFTGSVQLLSALCEHNYSLAVATGKARRGLNRAWAQTNTGQFFEYSRCADEAESKPSPDMLKQLLDVTGLKPSQAVMIGDTTYDMQMAASLGMDRIAVNYGVHQEADLRQHQPIFVADSISHLHQFLLPH